MQSPLVNIFVPTYNPRPEHLRAALDCVLAQTCGRWTLRIHDDASETDVAAIVKPYLADPRIAFTRSSKRLGIGGNWNACRKYLYAPFCQYLFQDDAWTPDYLQKSIDALQAFPSAVFSAAHHGYRDDTGATVGGLYADVQAAKAAALRPGLTVGKTFLMEWMRRGLHPNLIGEPSFVLMRSSAVMKAGRFSQSMQQCLDVEYWTRLLLTGDWIWLPEELGTFRVHPQAATAQNEGKGAGIFDRFRCLLAVRKALTDPAEDAASTAAINEQALLMVAKFFRRKSGGQSAGGGMFSLPLGAYPILLRALVRHMFVQLRRKSQKHVASEEIVPVSSAT